MCVGNGSFVSFYVSIIYKSVGVLVIHRTWGESNVLSAQHGVWRASLRKMWPGSEAGWMNINNPCFFLCVLLNLDGTCGRKKKYVVKKFSEYIEVQGEQTLSRAMVATIMLQNNNLSWVRQRPMLVRQEARKNPSPTELCKLETNSTTQTFLDRRNCLPT